MENTENTYNVSVLERKALDLLETYQGANNYIIRLRQKQIDNKKFYPTRAQAEYIINYHEMAPKVAKKWVELDSYFAQKIANDKLLSSVPTRVYVEKLLVEKDTAYHIWGKYFDSEQVYDFWIPKVALIKDNKVKDVVIDYEK